MVPGPLPVSEPWARVDLLARSCVCLLMCVFASSASANEGTPGQGSSLSTAEHLCEGIGQKSKVKRPLGQRTVPAICRATTE